MKNPKLHKAVFSAMVIIFWLTAAGWADSTDPVLEKAAALKSHLTSRGFQVLGDVSYARFVPADPIQLYCDGKLDSCNGFNYGGTYDVPLVPKLDGQADTFTQNDKLFRIRKNEAVVLVGETPPPCDFYSYVCYLFYRYEEGWGHFNLRKIFSTMADPLNLAVLNTGGMIYNANFVMTFTSDEVTDDAVRMAALQAGFPMNILNTFVIPSSLLKTNDALDDSTDQLMILNRTALWHDGTSDGSGYVQNPRVVVFRVTPPTTLHKPLSAPIQRVRGTGVTEVNYGTAVAQLRQAILTRYANLSADELTTAQWLLESPIAVQTWTNTLGDSADTVYLNSREPFKLSDAPDDFLIAYGVNHQKAQKSTYHNISVYEQFKACGVASAYDHCYGNANCVAFGGSATEYIQGQMPAPLADHLYALKIARKCGAGERYCLQVKEPTQNCGEGAALDDGLFIGFRAYLEPWTRTGPAYTELLYDKVIHFTPIPPPVVKPSRTAYTGTVGEPVTVSFDITSASQNDVTWQAQLEYVDIIGCGTILPDQGTIQGGTGAASFTFTADFPGPNQIPGLYYVTITATDKQGRSATTEVLIQVYKPNS